MSTHQHTPPLPEPDALPLAMVETDNWVAADPDKIPYDPKTGRKASPTDPATWGALPQALAFARRRGWAVGFVLTRKAGIVAVDLDKCRDPATGAITVYAKSIVSRLPTYTEPSISGTGLHLYALGTLPPGGRKRGQVEMYNDARYVIVTGQPWAGCDQLTDCTKAIAKLHRETFPPDPTPAAPSPTGPLTLDTEEILRRCQGSARFQRLYAGDMSDYRDESKDGVDHSAADLALCNIVVRNGGTRAQADEIMRSSGLCRDKWDARRGARTYGEETLDKAFNGHVEPFRQRIARDQDSFIVNPQVAVLDPLPLAATGTDDALPDDVDALKAMIVTLTHRVEAAEQRAERAEARAAEAERKTAMLSRVQSRTVGIIRNNRLRQERFTAIALTNLFAHRESAGIRQADEQDDGLYKIPLGAVAEAAGISEDTASKHIATFETTGVLKKRKRWVPERINRETGEITPGRWRQFIGPATNVVDFVEAVAALDPKRTRKDGTEVGAWGGARTSCPDHPNAGTVKRWTLHCAECDRQLDAGEERIDAEEGNPQLADVAPSVASHYRSRNGGIDYNDLPAADGTVAGAWLHGAPLPGMGPRQHGDLSPGGPAP
jgi:primase-polymerase (primpol)-like protein